MSDRLDKTLEVLDVGLQSSAETGYGTDASPRYCARCQLHRIAGHDLCGGCRAFLLGDSEVDPTRRLPLSGIRVLDDGTLGGYLVVVGEAEREALDRIRGGLAPTLEDLEILAAAFRDMAMAVWETLEPWVDAVTAAFARTAEQVVAGVEVLQKLVGDVREFLPPAGPTARSRERDLLEDRRRAHRRTNRWGPPPGRK